MKFLGHVIIKDSISIVDVKVYAVYDWPVSKTLQDIQGFYSLNSFYGRFIRQFIKVSELITSLMKRDMCVNGLKHVKQYLTS